MQVVLRCIRSISPFMTYGDRILMTVNYKPINFGRTPTPLEWRSHGDIPSNKMLLESEISFINLHTEGEFYQWHVSKVVGSSWNKCFSSDLGSISYDQLQRCLKVIRKFDDPSDSKYDEAIHQLTNILEQNAEN